MNLTYVGKELDVSLHPLLGHLSVSLLVASNVRNSCMGCSDFEVICKLKHHPG